ncbi:MAG: hypothetical protein PHW89_08110 [Sulfurimonas denitrificans]|nr:hypothetical protein [Sulfurimonas denitrificans]
MINVKLDLTYTNNSIKTANYELQFKYNTDADYFYFDLFSSNGDLIRLHNKVVTGYDYGTGIRFTSSDSASYANAQNIANFTAVLDG